MKQMEKPSDYRTEKDAETLSMRAALDRRSTSKAMIPAVSNPVLPAPSSGKKMMIPSCSGAHLPTVCLASQLLETHSFNPSVGPEGARELIDMKQLNTGLEEIAARKQAPVI